MTNPPGTTLPAKSKPTALRVVTVGTKQIATGGWHRADALFHLEYHLTQPLTWCSPECLGRWLRGRQTKANADWVRDHLAGLFRWALGQGRFVVISYDVPGKRKDGSRSYGEALAMKILDVQHHSERTFAEQQLQRMERMREVKSAQLDAARALMGPAPVTEMVAPNED